MVETDYSSGSSRSFKPSHASNIPGAPAERILLILLVVLSVFPGFSPAAGNAGISFPSGNFSETITRFDLNLADREELVTVPGISGDLADIIILYRNLKRPFEDMEHFFRVVNATLEERLIFERAFRVGPDRFADPLPLAAGLSLPDGENGIPTASMGPRSFRFCVISDSNSTYGSIAQGAGVSAAMKAIVERLKPELVVHNGDMVAGQKKSLDKERIEAMWNQYFQAVADPLALAGIILAPVGGNHDASAGFKDRDIFISRWTESPRVPNLDFSCREEFPLFYSFNYKGASFVVLGAVNGHMKAGEVETAVKLLERSAGKPLFVFNHVPFEKLHRKNHGRLAPEDRLYAIFIASGVDLFFSSHYELYFRGFYKNLPVVSTGVLAAVDRRLLGTDVPQGMSFVAIDVVDGKVSRVFGVKGPRFDTCFDESVLTEEFGNYRRFNRKHKKH